MVSLLLLFLLVFIYLINFLSHLFWSSLFNVNTLVYRWLNPQNTLRDEGVQGNSYVIMKIKYFKLPKKLFDPVAVHLYYLQVWH